MRDFASPLISELALNKELVRVREKAECCVALDAEPREVVKDFASPFT